MSTTPIVLPGQNVGAASGGGGGDPTDVFYFQNLDDDGATLYIGKSKTDGTWRVEKVVETGSDLATTYASETNNGSYSTYATAWTNRLTLTYGDISTT
jgi:hypothetical protein